MTRVPSATAQNTTDLYPDAGGTVPDFPAGGGTVPDFPFINVNKLNDINNTHENAQINFNQLKEKIKIPFDKNSILKNNFANHFGDQVQLSDTQIEIRLLRNL